ncbi:hypothetical protein D9615_003641 [Tricholomella constricta]|uniref:RNA helicase n=1 Tax=Tricholomella constricta TaxID=117010 RepID=A0A8H5HIB9_9AGAR|nr:hypothetical protein D9615_003641 [Tricholomella constricta]
MAPSLSCCWQVPGTRIVQAYTWTTLTAAQRSTIKSQYAAAGIKLIVSAFGATDVPTTTNADPVATANTFAAWVKQYSLDGIDVDYEDFGAFQAGTAEAWLVSFTKQLRVQLPQGSYIVTHAPVAPWFTPNRWPGGGYLKVHTSVGSSIDWYNVQFYNQGASEYTTCSGLLTTSSSTWPQSAVFQIASNGVPLSKIVIGKPATTSDASNGFMSTSTLATCLQQAKNQGWIPESGYDLDQERSLIVLASLMNGLYKAFFVIRPQRIRMSSTSKLIRLTTKGKQTAYDDFRAKKFGKKTQVPWVDVSDDEDRPRKTPLKVMPNGRQPHQDGRQDRNNKKARRSQDTADEPATPGASGSGSPINLQEQRRKLPIAKGREALIREIQSNDVTVLLGETGSGKTTRNCAYPSACQVPQYILESGLAGRGMIAVTQPRKVAATSLAGRVAAEKDAAVGKLVGYSVRFDERSSAETRIKYMTDGMIVRELLSDPLLNQYSVVIVDEAHERTLRTDLLIANLKTIQKERNGPADGSGKGKGNANKLNPLKIVIMSATLDAEKFSKFFDNAKILYIKGRQHPVKLYYSSEGQTDYVDSAMRTFFQIHTDQPPGDVLIFLPGQEDIESLEKSIKLFADQLPKDETEVFVCSMYAAQAPGQNAKVFATTPPNARKCILSTNIAETSITIPGVKYVIDTGMCKEKRYLAKGTGGGFDTLLTKSITKSSAMQRAGRAGRESMGVCFRLYTEESYNKMALAPEPEIMRCSLTSSLLQLKCLNQDLEDLDLMDMPDVDSIASALKTLWLLDAINPNKELTPLGRQMAFFPLEPVHARSVIASKEHGCTVEVLDIISVLSASSKLFVDITEQRETAAEARRMFRHASGDHLTILNAVRAYEEIARGNGGRGARKEWCRKHFLNERTLLEAAEIKNQLKQTCGRLGIDWKVSCGDKEEPVVRSLAYGLAQNSAFLQPDGSYKQTMGQSVVKIHPGSVLCEKKVPAIIYDELIFTNQIFARGVSSVQKSVFASIGALNRRIA